MSFQIQMITGTIQIVTGLHIGSGNTEMHIGGTDNPVIRDEMTKLPYIPGSSIKGKMRSLLTLYANDDNNEKIIKLFGMSGDKKNNEGEDFKPARLSFWDCFISAESRKLVKEKQLDLATEIKMENSIDRTTGIANPRNTERVLPGVEFDFRLSLKVFEDEDFLSVVLGGLKLLEMDSLGGSGSRGYGKIRFNNLQIDGRDIQAKLDAVKPFAENKRFI